MRRVVGVCNMCEFGSKERKGKKLGEGMWGDET
jgi:hypothetical protein